MLQRSCLLANTNVGELALLMASQAVRANAASGRIAMLGRGEAEEGDGSEDGLELHGGCSTHVSKVRYMFQCLITHCKRCSR